ncbi:tyrosine-type recombinase/integrase [Streptomyces sp. NPDC090442]|uniref:tyrosine-type recombinase/integrase n=1 Tax=Streptomyces sp. NPDC090442 TaxID=3365962 RepID=UPI00381653C8
MTTIRQHAEEYLAMRRRLGFKLTSFGEKLMSFVSYLEHTGATVLTTEAALTWATSTPRSTDQVHWSRRLMVVRVFARHLKALEPATEIPPDDALPHHYRRITPHLFTPAELAALLQVTGILRPAFRARTWHTLLGLLAVTGLRTSEACGLDRTDVDLTSGLLTVRDTKFGKSRQVPVHTSTTAALRKYARERDRQRPAPSTVAFLVSTRGTRLDAHSLPRTFAQLLEAADITAGEGRRRPRLHDLRHTFATTTLLNWYRNDADVQAKLPLLTTYLGHADPKSTYWYLSGSPELLSLAATRLEHSFGGRP